MKCLIVNSGGVTGTLGDSGNAQNGRVVDGEAHGDVSQAFRRGCTVSKPPANLVRPSFTPFFTARRRPSPARTRISSGSNFATSMHR
jgi:hypothetical protein